MICIELSDIKMLLFLILENNKIKMLQKQMIFNKFIRNILWNLREFQRIISPLDAGSFS